MLLYFCHRVSVVLSLLLHWFYSHAFAFVLYKNNSLLLFILLFFLYLLIFLVLFLVVCLLLLVRCFSLFIVCLFTVHKSKGVVVVVAIVIIICLLLILTKFSCAGNFAILLNNPGYYNSKHCLVNFHSNLTKFSS